MVFHVFPFEKTLLPAKGRLFDSMISGSFLVSWIRLGFKINIYIYILEGTDIWMTVHYLLAPSAWRTLRFRYCTLDASPHQNKWYLKRTVQWPQDHRFALNIFKPEATNRTNKLKIMTHNPFKEMSPSTELGSTPPKRTFHREKTNTPERCIAKSVKKEIQMFLSRWDHPECFGIRTVHPDQSAQSLSTQLSP